VTSADFHRLGPISQLLVFAFFLFYLWRHQPAEVQA